jgi:uncharacterized protein YgbK (DUF1537 family)
MSQIIFGCVADDFTGASDAASFLVKGGFKTILINGVPDHDLNVEGDCDAAVIALKTRTQETSQAVEDTLHAVKWLRQRGAHQIFLKYCSTFDSTKHGNIGPIVDKILEEYDVHYTILCPALPVNERIVKDGRLYVDGLPLDESHMKNHPLTPMWDSDIANLMKPQGKYACFKVNSEMMKKTKQEILHAIDEFGKDKRHFYVIPDFIYDKDAEKIVNVFGDLPVLTGGSGLMEEIGKKYHAKRHPETNSVLSGTDGPALVLAGSCSKATLAQIAYFQKSGAKSIQLIPSEIHDPHRIDEIWNFILENKENRILVYSSGSETNIEEERKNAKKWWENASLLENMTAEIADRAVHAGFTRIIVAGGETSGAVTKKLGFNSFFIGESIAPGVPIMIPTDHKNIRLILKSGNFGQKDFFNRSLDMTENKESEKL